MEWKNTMGAAWVEPWKGTVQYQKWTFPLMQSLGNTATHLLQFILIGHCRHLEVALHLLANLLEAVHYGEAGNRVYATQRVETHSRQVVLTGDLSEVDDGLWDNELASLTVNEQQNKQTPWSESARELYRPSDRRLSAK
jgi:hypothetical protein